MLKSFRSGAALVAILAAQLNTTFIAKPASAQEQSTPPAYVKVAETENGDQIYIVTKTVHKARFQRYRTVRYTIVIYHEKPDTDGTVKVSARYGAICDTNSLELDSFVKYNRSNQIIDWMEYNMTTPTPHQSTEPAGVRYAYPGTVAAATLDYVCSQ